VFPKDQGGFDIDDQYFIGSSGLLVKPVTEKDVTETTVYLAEDQVIIFYSFGYHLFTLFPRSTTTTSTITPTVELQKANTSPSQQLCTKSLSSSVVVQLYLPASAQGGHQHP
jgi:hypothetical protein